MPDNAAMSWWTLFILCAGLTKASTKGLLALPEIHQLQRNPDVNHQVYIFHKSLATFLCYGVNFQPNYFLTPASCFDKFREQGNLVIEENSVYVSSINRPFPNGPSGPAVGILVHPNYKILTGQNYVKGERRYDLAIVRVFQAFDQTTKPINLSQKTPSIFSACSLTAFKESSPSSNLEHLTVNVIPTGDCISNNSQSDGLTSLFCVQIKHKATIKDEYFPGAVVTCKNDVSGVYSYGYDSKKEINNILVTSFASELQWIQEHQDEGFALPGHSNTPVTNPTSNTAVTGTKPTSDTPVSKPTTLDTSVSKPTPNPNNPCYPDSVHDYDYPCDYDDDSSVQNLPFSLQLILLIATTVIKFTGI